MKRQAGYTGSVMLNIPCCLPFGALLSLLESNGLGLLVRHVLREARQSCNRLRVSVV